ncbi:hypothetical protein Ade02nite_20200 [Paractinoplanes deccanensis]|uniref:Uncharacterized protein n=1 Tax=Paractinoplanes deccanensis TaxID=113561 RepID=A0ABQ3Y067_9ACTN|nr:hypothetical protein [Actinoplanes deccanensis]GID73379.1 hypothetical protein Ade02nite_20200 [Actinoplanes deccanensis]
MAIHAPTNTELADHARTALVTAGLTPDDAAQIVSVLYPAGLHEVICTLTADPDALHWMGAIGSHTFADRFRCYVYEAAHIQRIIRDMLAAAR